MPGLAGDYGWVLWLSHDDEHLGSGVVGSEETACLCLRHCERGCCVWAFDYGNWESQVDGWVDDAGLLCSMSLSACIRLLHGILCILGWHIYFPYSKREACDYRCDGLLEPTL